MRITPFLSLAALATAIVIPDEQVLAAIPIESHRQPSLLDRIPSFGGIIHDVKKTFRKSHHRHHGHDLQSTGNPLDDALLSMKGHKCKHSKKVATKDHKLGFDFESWIADPLDGPHHPRPRWRFPHFKNPFKGPPGKGKGPGKKPHPGPPHHGPPHHGPPHHGPPHHGPHGHRHHHHKPNLTIYQLISQSKFTTNLTKLIDEDKDLVSLLNSTKANYTLFAPTDWAFAKIPKGAPKPSKEFIKKLLSYHVSPDFWPIGKLLFTHTAPTTLELDSLGGKPQRILAKFGFRGIRLNYYSKVLARNIPATNGIIHGIDSILLPPPSSTAIITHLPGTFSTLTLGLGSTGLLDVINNTAHAGGTFFAPTNTAFKKLGPRANAFLFSAHGTKFLGALLKYHIVPDKTLYSTAYYDSAQKDAVEIFPQNKGHHGCHKKQDHVDERSTGIDKKAFPPGRVVHLDLPTLLKRGLSIDIVRHGPWIDFRVNALVHVAAQDGLASDGVLQVVNSVLIPPRTPGLAGVDADFWQGGEISVEELKERLGPIVDDDMPQDNQRQIPMGGEKKWDL